MGVRMDPIKDVRGYGRNRYIGVREGSVNVVFDV